MAILRRLTALIEREDDLWVALCPEVDVVSQGQTIEEARTNLIEALTLFFEHADPSEIACSLHDEVLVTSVEVPVPVEQVTAAFGQGSLRDPRQTRIY